LRSRVLVFVVAAAAVLTACGPADVGAPQLETTGVDQPRDDGASSDDGRSSTADGGSEASDPASDGREEPGSTEGSGDDVPKATDQGGTDLTPVDDRGRVGANGRAYLRGDRSRTIIEVDAQEGASVDDDAIAHLRDTLARVSDRDEMVFAGGETFTSERREWSRDDLRAAAESHRDNYSDDTTTVLYVLIVRGGFTRDGERTEAIGVAYNGSEMALFPDRWSDLAGSLTGSSRQVERAVAVHELGHLLGLVNLTYTSEIDHEDPEHPGHSSNRDSVMYWAVETTLIGQVFSGPPPDTFDDADLADLVGLKDGRY
jgi:hypothetical protein